MKRWILTALISLAFHCTYGTNKESVNVTFLSEGYKLSGEVIYPKTAQGKVPAIIFLSGSGDRSSYLDDYKNFLKFFLKDPLDQENVALMFFDKRGVGLSEGKWFKTDFEQRAVDAKNAAEHLRTMPNIDISKIFVVGHSQGGWIVQICLAEYPDIFAGGVSMAGPTFSVRKQIINDYQNKYICEEDYSEEDALVKANKKVRFDLTMVSLLPIKDYWKQLNVIKHFDPEPYLQKIEKPLLFMYAENDKLVSPEWSKEALNEIYPKGLPENFEVYVASGENHSFKKSPLCYSGPGKDLIYSEVSRNKLNDWLKHEMFN